MREALQFRDALGSESALLDADKTSAPLPGLTKGGTARLRHMVRERVHLQEADDVRKIGAQILFYGSPGYPETLTGIRQAPTVLFIRGRLPCSAVPPLAIVGSRRCTPEGRRRARELGIFMAGQGVSVVSGMARGIDAAAIQGCYDGHGRPIGVLGTGLDQIYPPENIRLYQDTWTAGALLTEFPLGTAPLKQNFPRRNRIISGLSKAILIVEASEKSGSLITADHGLDQDRTVMAMPGPVGPPFFRGSNRLIRDGACVVLEPEDIMAALNLACVKSDKPENDRSSDAAETMDEVAACCRHEALTLDQLANRTGLAHEELLCRVSRLELDGTLQRVPGARFLMKTASEETVASKDVRERDVKVQKAGKLQR